MARQLNQNVQLFSSGIYAPLSGSPNDMGTARFEGQVQLKYEYGGMPVSIDFHYTRPDGTTSTKSIDDGMINNDGTFSFELYYNDASHLGTWGITSAVVNYGGYSKM